MTNNGDRCATNHPVVTEHHRLWLALTEGQLATNCSSAIVARLANLQQTEQAKSQQMLHCNKKACTFLGTAYNLQNVAVQQFGARQQFFRLLTFINNSFIGD